MVARSFPGRRNGEGRADECHADQRGAVTPWVLGLTVLLLFMSMMVVDLAGAVSDRRVLAAMADAAAAAGASGIDEGRVRTDGGVGLPQSPTGPDQARSGPAHPALTLQLVRRRAEDSINAQSATDRALLTHPPDIAVVEGQVVVRLRGRGRIGILGAVSGDADLQVTAVARPRQRG